MRSSVLLVRLQSYAALKAVNTFGRLTRLLKFILRHPFKTLFALIKIWFALMFFTLFSFMVMAAPLDMNSLKDPKIETYFSYDCKIGNDTFGSVKTLGECYETYNPQYIALIPSTGSCTTNTEIMSQTATFIKIRVNRYTERTLSDGSKRCDLNAYVANVKLTNQVETEGPTCPPVGFPNHIYEVMQGSDMKCAQLAQDPNLDPEQKTCDELVGNDSSFYGVTVNANKHPDASQIKCLENGAKFCETTSTVFIDTEMGDNFVRYSPVGGGTFTGAECTDSTNTTPPPDSESPEDKFCNVSNSDGIYLVDCPESTIALNWNTVLALAETSNLDNQRIAAIESTFMTKTEINTLVEQVEQAQKGEKGDKGDKGDTGARGATGLNGLDGEDGEDGEDCSIIQTTEGAAITCGASTATVKSGDSCTTKTLPNGDSQISCEDGTISTINGIDEDGIISALNTQLTEMKKQTGELEGQTELLGKIAEYDGDKPKIDYETKPDAYTEILEFDWDENNFGTVMEKHIDEMQKLPLFSAIDGFFDTSFGGTCPVWETNVSVMQASFNVRIDQFCSSAVQSILPYIRAILMLVAGFFAWRIAIE